MTKKHTKLGKVIVWIGFLFFMSGFFIVTDLAGEDTPEAFYPFAMPSIIIGIILLIASNFFKKKK
ncbi:hypothetical protein VBD025_15780 [Virgibacillus flavescens]|uniref:hypothetical protein n=1 Tax=Virgibacillus flavescens TaxID=1611422 RepID=UPI003D32EFEF